MIDFLGYKGIVEISDGISSIKTHNSGKSAVAELFTRAVLGYPSKNKRPSKLDILDENENSLLFDKSLVRSASFEIISSEDEYNGWMYPVLDIIILSENLNLDDYSNGKVCYLVLYNDLDEEFARVQITIKPPVENKSNENTLYYHFGNNILIRWYMYITNKNED